MAHYWKRCPYCGRVVEEGSGRIFKKFGDPEITCRHCRKIYKDRSIINWPTATLLEKILFCLANGRAFLCIAMYLISSSLLDVKLDCENGLAYLVCLPIFFVTLVVCIVYVMIRVKMYYGDEIIPINYKKLDKELCETVPPEILKFYSEYSVDFLKRFILWVDKFSSKSNSPLKYLKTLDGCVSNKTKETGLQICYKIYLNNMNFRKDNISHMFNQLDNVIACRDENDKTKKQQMVINGLQGFIVARMISGDNYK